MEVRSRFFFHIKIKTDNSPQHEQHKSWQSEDDDEDDGWPSESSHQKTYSIGG